MPATPAWLAAAEALLNRGIGASPQATALARRLNCTVLRVDIGTTSFHISASHGRVSLLNAAAAPADPPASAIISGSPAALLALARGGAAGRAATPAQVQGDAEVANAYRQLIALAVPDWEDELSRVVGDVPARRLSQLAQRTVAWMRKTRHVAGENISEYLQEEGRDVVNRTELAEFLQGVDALRESADRAAARLARLERHVKASR